MRFKITITIMTGEVDPSVVLEAAEEGTQEMLGYLHAHSVGAVQLDDGTSPSVRELHPSAGGGAYRVGEEVRRTK